MHVELLAVLCVLTLSSVCSVHCCPQPDSNMGAPAFGGELSCTPFLPASVLYFRCVPRISIYGSCILLFLIFTYLSVSDCIRPELWCMGSVAPQHVGSQLPNQGLNPHPSYSCILKYSLTVSVF